MKNIKITLKNASKRENHPTPYFSSIRNDNHWETGELTEAMP